MHIVSVSLWGGEEVGSMRAQAYALKDYVNEYDVGIRGQYETPGISSERVSPTSMLCACGQYHIYL